MQMLSVGSFLASSLGTVYTAIYARSFTAIRQTRSAQPIPCPQQLALSVEFSPHVMVHQLRVGATR